MIILAITGIKKRLARELVTDLNLQVLKRHFSLKGSTEQIFI